MIFYLRLASLSKKLQPASSVHSSLSQWTYSTSGFDNSTTDATKRSHKSDGRLVDTVKKMRHRLGDDSISRDQNPRSQWDDLWKEGLTPWDLGKPTPALIYELERQRQRGSQMDYLRCKSTFSTLVPGCGAGYDLISLLRFQGELVSEMDTISDSVVVGLDISETSLERAANVINASSNKMETPSRSLITTTRIELKRGDFFDDASSWLTVETDSSPPKKLNNGGKEKIQPCHFDLIYDYTFFCALPPSLRDAWGQRIARLLRPETGKLLTFVFPILPDEEDSMKGPPYPVKVQDYQEVLEPHGVILESEAYENPHTVPSRAGKELVCWWKLYS